MVNSSQQAGLVQFSLGFNGAKCKWGVGACTAMNWKQSQDICLVNSEKSHVGVEVQVCRTDMVEKVTRFRWMCI